LFEKIIMVRSLKNADHYSWGTGCDGWYLLKNDRLNVIQERMPPGASEQKHYHANAQQFFFILSGVATFEIEDQTICVNANESLHIAKGTKHCIKNNETEDLMFLLISEPPSQNDRINL
jgi:quercetin dioxygenase-like cupin family protein